MLDDTDIDFNYTTEDSQFYDDYESSFGSSQHSAHSLEIHRNEMNLDDNNTIQKEIEIIDDDKNKEHSSNRTPSYVWEYVDKETNPNKPRCKLCGKKFSQRSSIS